MSRWVMNAHGNWSCGSWTAKRYVSGGWMLSLRDEEGRWHRSLVDCQRTVKLLGANK